MSFAVASSSVSLSTTAVGTTTTTSPDGSSVDIALGTSIVSATIAASSWHVDATVAADFTSGGASIAKSSAAFYVPGTPTAPTIGVLCTTLLKKSQATSVDPVTGTTTDIIQCPSAGGGTGATFTPVLRVTIPAGTVAGTYNGTVTQSAY